MPCFLHVLILASALLVSAVCGHIDTTPTSSKVLNLEAPVVDVCPVACGHDAECEEKTLQEDSWDEGLSFLQHRVQQRIDVASHTQEDGAEIEEEHASDDIEVSKFDDAASEHLKDLAKDVDSVQESSSRRRRGRSKQSGTSNTGPSASSSSSFKPTATELQTLAAVVGRLWSIDAPYRLDPGRGFKLNHQAKAASLSSKKDTSPAPLFKYVDQTKLRKAPCASTFLALLDNFERQTDRTEISTAQEKRELDAFMRELMQTPHMKYAYNVLVAWKTIQPGYSAFAKKVQDMWFTQYSLKKRGPKVSSGFEHVFVGEEKLDKRTHRPTITGLHNWLQFWREEKAGRIDYLGYVGKAGGDRLVSVRFAWDDNDPDRETKSVSTILVGSSVPFEFAMLTCAFLGFGGEAKVPGIYFGNTGPAKITTYSWKSQQGTVVRTAYLEG